MQRPACQPCCPSTAGAASPLIWLLESIFLEPVCHLKCTVLLDVTDKHNNRTKPLYVSYVGLDPLSTEWGISAFSAPFPLLTSQIQSCQYPSHHITPFLSSLAPGARVRICVHVRRGQVQCEFLRVLLLMTCSFTQRVSPVGFSVPL